MGSSGERRSPTPLVLGQDPVRVDLTLERLEEGLASVPRRLMRIVQGVQAKSPDPAAEAAIAVGSSAAGHH